MNPLEGVGSSNAQDDLLTVNRGSSFSHIERISKFWNDLVVADATETETKLVIQNAKNLKWNYCGAFYSVNFRSSTPILLKQLGFFGPFTEPIATYLVHIEIFKARDNTQKMPNSWDSVQVAKMNMNIDAKRDEVFYVDLGEGVPISRNTWHLIQFKLDGPATLRSESCCTQVKVESGEGTVNFQFSEGSLQLPSMKFRVSRSQ